ncbi:HalOD1 output domain-containing protein [Haloprofundus salinisoli]|uniref:HalOD1 output domain-containing protein n=1 Tax=Haloprofundus salinisoli TaxID=2876193 RepID=UPI001CCCB97F|nr:HalOD1 output domain-containing protein [Haloprofundus salinisoli]
MSSTVNSPSERRTHHLRHEWGVDGQISDRIIRAIAEYEDNRPEDLPGLETRINPEALNTAFETEESSGCTAGCITFSYYGYTVLVQSTGHILIKKN